MSISKSGGSSPKGGRLAAYEQKTFGYMMALALVFVVVYAVPILDEQLPNWLGRCFAIATPIIWLAFLADLVCRVVLSKRPIHYLIHHPLDVLIVALPILRPLRVLRLFTAGKTLMNNSGRFPLMQTTWSIVCVAALLVFIGGVAVLDAERHAAGSNITSASQAFWWSAGNITTVTYNSAYPVTATGKLVAVTLTIIGLALIGVITAAVAAWFMTQTRTTVRDAESQLDAAPRCFGKQNRLDSYSCDT